MKKIIVIFFVLITTAVVRNDLRFDFLDIGANARVQGLGNVGSIAARGPEAALYNPALLIGEHKGLLFSYNSYKFDISQYYIFYERSLRNNFKFGVGYIGNRVNDIEYREGRNDSPKLASVGNQALIVSLARKFNSKYRVGINAMLMSNDYSSGYDKNKNMLLTLAAANKISSKILLTGTVRLYGAEYQRYTLGISYSAEVFNVYFQPLIFLNDTEITTKLAGGIEFFVINGLSLNTGYNGYYFSAGFSHELNNLLDFNYAIQFLEIDTRHNFSFGLDL